MPNQIIISAHVDTNPKNSDVILKNETPRKKMVIFGSKLPENYESGKKIAIIRKTCLEFDVDHTAFSSRSLEAILRKLETSKFSYFTIFEPVNIVFHAFYNLNGCFRHT